MDCSAYWFPRLGLLGLAGSMGLGWVFGFFGLGLNAACFAMSYICTVMSFYYYFELFSLGFGCFAMLRLFVDECRGLLF